ncbi:MAG: hypothetical protein U1D26_00715 [Patescibacteria group bacterium]|nr:hypothetical protein [Patescibacteria group bacterium]
MPPQDPIPNENKDRLLPPAHRTSAGPIIGVIIIVLLLVVGALYFWGSHLNSDNSPDQLPLIPGDSPTTTPQ